MVSEVTARVSPVVGRIIERAKANQGVGGMAFEMRVKVEMPWEKAAGVWSG